MTHCFKGWACRNDITDHSRAPALLYPILPPPHFFKPESYIISEEL